MDLATVEFLKPAKFVLESVVLDREVLILVEQVVDFELQLRQGHALSAELILQLDEFVFELNTHFPFVIEVVFHFVLVFLELLAFILEHELKFSHIMVFERV